MARAKRNFCELCEHRLMAEVPFYEESDFVLYGCKKPKPAKFRGRTDKPCHDFSDYTGGMAEELGVTS